MAQQLIFPRNAFRPKSGTGPFEPVFVGGNVFLSPNSWLIFNPLQNTATRLSKSMATLTGNKMYLELSFNNAILQSTNVIVINGNWPSMSLYLPNKPARIEYQTILRCPLLSVHDGSQGLGDTDYAASGNTIFISRYVYSSLILMESCEGFFLTSGPSPAV